MESESEQFDAGDAQLLAYLVGELPAAELGEMKHRLAGDASLRARLDELRATYESTWRALDDVDRGRPIETSLRELQAAMRQSCVKRLTAPASAESGNNQQKWIWPSVAVAALLLVGIFVWRRSSVEQTDENQFVENVADEIDLRREVALDNAERELEAVAFLHQTLTYTEE